MSNLRRFQLSILRRLHDFQPNYVPKHEAARPEDIEQLKNFIEVSRRLVVLTGAGISTESGIPDYRSEEVGLYARTNHKPIQYQDFITKPSARQRYWARNYIGWPRFASTQPNLSHNALTSLEARGKIAAIITQNVDSLHGKAGSRNVIELHGSAYRVSCLNCGAVYDRHDVQRIMSELNPDLHETVTMIRPDGDVEIPTEKIADFKTPSCECTGILKPDIVFFGDNVPKSRVELVRGAVSEADSLLVLGTSLTVFSSYRIVLQALESQKRVCVVNIGPTRADALLNLKIKAKCSDILCNLL